MIGCESNKKEETLNAFYIEKPQETNLKHWITERITSKELEDEGCIYLPGWFGAEEFLDSGYSAIEEEGMMKAPDIHVTYLLTGYPDLLDELAITQIDITDPSITIYGLSINSTKEEIDNTLKDIAIETDYEDTYLIGLCSFTFNEEHIRISAPVTNNSGIVF